MSLVQTDAKLVERMILEREQNYGAALPEALLEHSNDGFVGQKTCIILATVMFVMLISIAVMLWQDPAPMGALRIFSAGALLLGLAACVVVSRILSRLSHAYSQSLERERGIADASPHLICSLDADGRILAVGPTSTSLLGYGPEEMSGNMLIAHILEEDIPSALKSLAVVAKQHAAGDFETRMRRKDGKVIHTSWSLQWSEAQQTSFCIAKDITPVKEMAELKREFMSMITHDLRSPLAAIVMNSKFLQVGGGGELPEEALQRLRSMEASGERMISLVNELLEIERAESGNMQLDRTKVTVQTVMEAARDAIQPLAEAKNIKVVYSESNDFFVADGRRLVQVLINLISNAIKFSPADSTIRVEVEMETLTVEFRVSDSGRGISPEDCPRVFDRFKQVELADATLRGGTGLGLAICKAIVDAHGGSIGVDSKIGAGSTFWFRLPVKA